jgi:hypothetical protein
VTQHQQQQSKQKPCGSNRTVTPYVCIARSFAECEHQTTSSGVQASSWKANHQRKEARRG